MVLQALEWSSTWNLGAKTVVIFNTVRGSWCISCTSLSLLSLIAMVVWLWLWGRSTTDANFSYIQFSGNEGDRGPTDKGCVVGWPRPAADYPHNCSLSPSTPSRTGQRIGSKINESRHAQFNRWRKEKKANNKQEITYHLSRVAWWPDSLWVTATKEVNPLPFSSSTSVCTAEHNIIYYGISL